MNSRETEVIKEAISPWKKKRKREGKGNTLLNAFGTEKDSLCQPKGEILCLDELLTVGTLSVIKYERHLDQHAGTRTTFRDHYER
jgi:hypothetical protein